MNPLSLRFMARQAGLLIAAVLLAFIAQDAKGSTLPIATAATVFIFASCRIASHVNNLRRKHRISGWLVIVALQVAAVAFAVHFISAPFLSIAFMIVELSAFIYFSIKRN